MIRRSEWGARQPKSVTAVSDKTGGIVIHHTAGRSPSVHWPDCWNRWKAHQNYHMDRKGWNDLAYNHLVCAHGFWFEGRGWDARNGANLPVNASTLSICWEGTTGDRVDPAAVTTINQIIGEAISRGWAAKVRGHQEVRPEPTACPGELQPLIADGTIGPNIPPPANSGTPVMGDIQVGVGQAVEFVRGRAAAADYPWDTIETIIDTVYRVAEDDGVRPDLALGLMLKETGFFGYGGDVKADQWNFGGIGATGGVPGLRFPTILAGVRAVIRRMRMYAVNDPAAYDVAVLGRPLPTSHWGQYPHIEDFNGVWAVPGTGYGQSIIAMVEKMKQTPVASESSSPFTDPEVTWLDSRYQRRSA